MVIFILKEFAIDGQLVMANTIRDKLVRTEWRMGEVPKSFPMDVPYKLHDWVYAPTLEKLAEKWGVVWIV